MSNQIASNGGSFIVQGDISVNKFSVVAQEFSNTDQNVIKITEDRLKLNLIQYEEAQRKRISWVTPVSLSASLLLALVTTANYKDFFGVKADVWNAIIILCFISCAFWSFVSIYRSISVGLKHKSLSPTEEFIDVCKRAK
jgi:hypothetical protein